eukprot:m.96520 g.96520  ORF g.96520 m.96520 type:complete len:646 (-) comp26900_c0_seq7:123-2060(-)
MRGCRNVCHLLQLPFSRLPPLTRVTSSRSMSSFFMDSKDLMAQLCQKCWGEGKTMVLPSKKARAEHRRLKARRIDEGLSEPSPPPMRPERCNTCLGVGIVTSNTRGTTADQQIKSCCDVTKNSTPPTIGIIGAGIGGVALALALQHRGIKVKVYEADSHFNQRQQGYGLTLQQGTIALQQLGINIDMGISSHSHFSFNPQGKLIGCYGRSLYKNSSVKNVHENENRKSNVCSSRRRNLHIPRQMLRLALLEMLDPTSIQWGSKVVDYKEITRVDGVDSTTHSFGTACVSQSAAIPAQLNHNASTTASVSKTNIVSNNEIDHTESTSAAANVCTSTAGESAVQLVFENGTTDVCDLLVGADGIFSMVRKKKIGDPLRYLGTVVILGFTKSCHPLTDHRIFQTLDGVTRLYTMPFADESTAVKLGLTETKSRLTMWQLSFPVSIEEAEKICKDKTSLKAEALKRCGDWHVPIPTLLKTTDLSVISGYPVFDREMPSPQTFRGALTSCVTMLGDACHPMSPFKGQGANQALLDAVALARHVYRTNLKHTSDCRRRTGGQHRGNLPIVSIEKALGSFEADMLSRSKAKVLQSREAAMVLHSKAALASENCTRAAAAKSHKNDDDIAQALTAEEFEMAKKSVSDLGLPQN